MQLHKLIFASLLLVNGGVFAQSLPINPDARLKIGGHVSFNQSAYQQDSTTRIFPQAFYDNNRVYIEGAEAGYYPYKDSKNEWRLTVAYDGRSFDPANSEGALQGLDKRDWSVMIGSSYMRITPYGGLKVHVETDVLGKSKGTTAKFAHLSRFKAMDDKLTVYPELGFLVSNNKYNQYYYGVSQDESNRTGVSVHQTNSNVSPYFNISASYAVLPRLSIFGSQSIEYMTDAQKESPLVDSRFDNKTKIGFNFEF